MPTQPKKCRAVMYSQQMTMLPDKTLDKFIERLEQKVKPEKYAVIRHDLDIADSGKPVAPHVHAMLTFKNARHVNAIAKDLSDKPQQVEIWNGNTGNGFAYLVHATEGARHKHQYKPEDVTANFDYPAELLKITKKVANAKSHFDTQILLDGLLEGTYTKEQVQDLMSGSQYAKAKRQIEDINALRLAKLSKQFRQEMLEQGKQLEVIWIFGSAGTGKTSLAKYAAKRDTPYYISGSTKDPFEQYAGQHTVILDEFRPGNMHYADLLRILDPYGEQTMAASRYHDKALSCDLIIITSPYSPVAFYNEEFNYCSAIPAYMQKPDNIDTKEQLLRRITLTIELTDSFINAVEYSNITHTYEKIPGASKANPFSQVSRPPAPVADKVTLFHSMF